MTFLILSATTRSIQRHSLGFLIFLVIDHLNLKMSPKQTPPANTGKQTPYLKKVLRHESIRSISNFKRWEIDEDETYRRTTLGDYFQAQSTYIADALGAKVLT